MYASKASKEIIKKAILTRVRWMKIINWTTYQFHPEMDLPEGYLKKEKEKLETALYNQWQKKWDENEHGRTTYKFRTLGFTKGAGDGSNQTDQVWT